MILNLSLKLRLNGKRKYKMNQILKFFSLQTLTSLINLFIPIFLVRIVSSEDVGEFRIFFFYLQAIPLLSLSSGIISSLPSWNNRKDQAKIYFEQSTSIILVQLALVFFLGLILYYPLKLFGLHYPYYFLLLFSSIIFIFSQFLDEIFISINKSDFAIYSIFLSESIKALAFIFFALKTQNVVHLFYIYLTIQILKVIINVYLLRKLNYFKFIWVESIKNEILSFSIPLGLSFFVGFFAEKGDQLIITLFASKTEFAFYGLGCLLIPPLLILEQTSTRLALPKMSLALAQNKQEEVHNHYVSMIELLSFALIPATFGLFYYAEDIIKLLFGDNYLKAAIYLKIYSFYYLSLSIPHDLYLRAQNKGKILLKLQILCSLITFALMLFFGYFYSSYGILTGYIVSKFVIKLLYIYQSSKEFKFDPYTLFPVKKFAQFFGITLLTLMFFEILHYFQIKIYFIFEILVFVLVYFIINSRYLREKILKQGKI